MHYRLNCILQCSFFVSIFNCLNVLKVSHPCTQCELSFLFGGGGLVNILHALTYENNFNGMENSQGKVRIKIPYTVLVGVKLSCSGSGKLMLHDAGYSLSAVILVCEFNNNYLCFSFHSVTSVLFLFNFIYIVTSNILMQ